MTVAGPPVEWPLYHPATSGRVRRRVALRSTVVGEEAMTGAEANLCEPVSAAGKGP